MKLKMMNWKKPKVKIKKYEHEYYYIPNISGFK